VKLFLLVPFFARPVLATPVLAFVPDAFQCPASSVAAPRPRVHLAYSVLVQPEYVFIPTCAWFWQSHGCTSSSTVRIVLKNYLVLHEQARAKTCDQESETVLNLLGKTCQIRDRPANHWSSLDGHRPTWGNVLFPRNRFGGRTETDEDTARGPPHAATPTAWLQASNHDAGWRLGVAVVQPRTPELAEAWLLPAYPCRRPRTRTCHRCHNRGVDGDRSTDRHRWTATLIEFACRRHGMDGLTDHGS
jgi:hypothetical protein